MCKKPMQIKALRRSHGLARPLLKNTRVAQSGAHVFSSPFHRESIMKTLLSILALGAALSTFGSAASAAAPASGSRDLFSSSDALSAATGPEVIQLARRGRGADDGAGDDRGGRGRGTDDGPNHTKAPVDESIQMARRGRGADDGAGHQRRGRGQDDGPNHT